MSDVPLTDKALSHAAAEFVWDVDGATETNASLLPAVLRLLRRGRSRTVLDLGCGNGASTESIARHGFEVEGWDGSRSGIETARRAHPQLKFVLSDLQHPPDRLSYGKYDAVVSTEVIEHLLLPRQLMQTAARVLRPGGLLIVSTPYHGYLKNLALALTNKFDDHWHPLRDFGHVKFFSRSTLTDLFRECGFQNVEFTTVGRIAVLARSMIVCGTKPE